MLRYAKFDMNVIQVAVWNEIQETGDRCWDLLGLMQSTGGLSPSYIIILLCKLISGKSSAWLLQHSQRLWLWSGTPCRRSISEVSQVKSHDKPWRVTSGSAVKPFASFGQRYGSTQAKQCSNGIQVAMPSSKWELHVRSDLGPFSLPSGSAMHSTCAVPKLRAQGNMAKKCTQFPKSSRKTLVWLCVIVKLGESANIKTASATETLCIFLCPGEDILIGLTLAWLVGRNHESRRRCFFFPECRSTNSRFDNVQYMPAYPSPSLMESTRMWRSIKWHAFLKRFWGKNGAPNLEDVACNVGYANCFPSKGRFKQQVTKHGPTWPGSQVSYEINKPTTHTYAYIIIYIYMYIYIYVDVYSWIYMMFP